MMQILDSAPYRIPATITGILLIQLGDIGDVVWTTPSIRAVKESLPGAQLSLMVKEGFGCLLEADPAVRQIYEVRRYPGNVLQQAARQLTFLKEIRAGHFDLVVDLRLGDRGAFMSLASGAPLRVTLHDPQSVPFWRKYFFTHGVAPADSPDQRGAADQSLRILRRLGIDTKDIVPRLWIADTVRQRVRKILIAEKVDSLKSWVTINPFSRWSYKEWNDQRWIEIIDWLWQDFTLPVMIIGSREEQSKAESIVRQCRAGAFNFAGKTSLAELAGVLSLSRLHIGVDSAAPHIAAAAGTPTVTIYGPSSWKDWAPVGMDHRVILPDMDCVPCHQKGCNGGGRSRCLEELDTRQVKAVLSEAIASLRPEASS